MSNPTGTKPVRAQQLRTTSSLLEDHLTKDNFPDLKELLDGQLNQRNQVALNLESTSNWNFLKRDSFKPLPDFMLQQYDSLQVSSFMGIFPEINRVWMTIDNHLYLWNYEGPEGGDLINTFEDPDQIIVNVCLVKPVPGVFLEQIEYLLVVSTPLEITLLGIAFSEAQKGTEPRGLLTIYKTDMSCYSDGINMSSIVGTKHGRIFMRGNDGQLFELVYQSQDGWLTRKIRKLNKSASSFAVFIPTIFNWAGRDPIRMLALDDERNLLYTVTKNNHIELISLGDDGSQFQKVAKISNLSDQLMRYNTFDDHIVSIHSITSAESRGLQCVAITSSGYRLYFTTNDSSFQYRLNNAKAYVPPTGLKLSYVLPPPPVTASLAQQGAKIHDALYFNGITVASQAMDDLDRVLMFAPHAGAIAQLPFKVMSEYASHFDIEGRTWAIAEFPGEQYRAIMNEKSFPGFQLNELATQFEFDARKFFLLTNGGLTTIIKLRPIDLFLKLINTSQTTDVKSFQEFFSSFGPDQCCAMCLALICDHPLISGGNFSVPPNVVTIVKRLYFEMGGIPSIANSHSSQNQSMGNAGAPLGIAVSTRELVYSPKHNGLVIYVARILRPIWKNSLLFEKSSSTSIPIYESKFKVEVLVTVQLKLQALDRFLKQYPKLTAPPTPDSRPSNIGDHDAWKVEQESLFSIHELVLKSIEAIAFLSILIDFKIANIAKSLNEHDQKELKAMTFEALVVTPKGKDLAKALMTALVNNQINKELGVESVIDSLQQRCPSICESNDVVLYKGLEHLRSAKSFANQSNAGQHIHEALRLFLTISKNISMDKLTEITESFKSFGFYQGIVDLALKRAQDFGNVEGLADHGQTTANENINQLRNQCYELIFKGLLSVEELPNTIVSGRAKVTKEDAKRLKAITLSRALDSNDKLFHYSLYSWYIEQDWIEQLMEIQSPYLEEYLLNQKGNIKYADLLGRLYTRKNMFFDAARLYCEVAHYPGLTLNQRLEYLSTALTNARSTSGTNSQEILTQITDELDVARVQADIITALEKIPNVEQELEELNSGLMDIGELFTRYARVHYLYEIILQIFFISDHSGDRNLGIIENCWEEIFRQTVNQSTERGQLPFEALSDKICDLGQRFYPDESVFPLKFLISKNEFLSFEFVEKGVTVPYGWVAKTFLTLKVPYSQIFQVYHDLFETKLPPWSSSKSITQLIQNIIVLIELWFEHIRSPSVGMNERDEFSARVIDEALSKYLVSIPVSAKALTNKLHSIQYRVRSVY